MMSTLNKIYEEGDDDMKVKIRESYVKSDLITGSCSEIEGANGNSISKYVKYEIS